MAEDSQGGKKGKAAKKDREREERKRKRGEADAAEKQRKRNKLLDVRPSNTFELSSLQEPAAGGLWSNVVRTEGLPQLFGGVAPSIFAPD